jgi:hypothetical protein
MLSSSKRSPSLIVSSQCEYTHGTLSELLDGNLVQMTLICHVTDVCSTIFLI